MATPKSMLVATLFMLSQCLATSAMHLPENIGTIRNKSHSSSPKKPLSKLGKIIIIAVVGGLVLAILLCVVCFFFLRKRNSRSKVASNPAGSAPPAFAPSTGFSMPSFGSGYKPVSGGAAGAPYVPPTGPTQYESTYDAQGNFDGGAYPSNAGPNQQYNSYASPYASPNNYGSPSGPPSGPPSGYAPYGPPAGPPPGR